MGQPLVVGPLALVLDAALPDLWDTPDLREGVAVDLQPSATVRVTLGLDAPGTAELERADLRLTWAPASGVYEGSGEGWRALLDPANHRARLDLACDERLRPLFLTAFLRAVSATTLPLGGCLMLHGAALVRPDTGRAAAFIGASDAGKSTMRERLGGWECLSDDAIVVAPDRGGARVFGTPFPGAERHPRVVRSVPLDRVVILEPHARDLALESLDAARAFAAVLERIVWLVEGGPHLGHLMELADRLVHALVVQRLASNLEHDVESLLCEAVA